MKNAEFAARLKQETQGVHVSSRLRQQTLDAAYGKEKIRMKRRIPALALVIVLSIVFCATALAITSRAGMLDYQKLFHNKYVPGNIAETIEQDAHANANDLVDISIRELYYDGRTSRITVDVKAKDESIFLTGFDTSGLESWAWMNHLNPEFNAGDTRTAAEVFTQGDYTASYNVCVGLLNEDFFTGSGDCFYTAPGVLTFFLTDSYLNDLPEREVVFQVKLDPFLDKEGNPIEDTPENTVRTEEKLTLTSSAQEGETYVNAEPVSFGEIGVTLEQMQLIVKPQELYVKLYYTISDTELNRRIYSANTRERTRLQLEFIDPSIVTDKPYNQRLSEGLTGSVTRRLLSKEDEMPMRFVEEFTLGLNELSESYTLRVFDSFTHARYDSAEVTLRKATEAEIEAFGAEK